MLTIILKRSAEPNVIQLTQENIMRELGAVNGSEMLLEDSWRAGLHRVRTPYVCLMEADCTLSSSYISSNLSFMKKSSMTDNNKGGGYTKLAMISSCLGVRDFGNRIYNYAIGDLVWSRKSAEGIQTSRRPLEPNRNKQSTALYHVQVGFVPGAIMRMASIKPVIDDLPWDAKNLADMSADVSLYLWSTGRRVQVNPNTTYVSNEAYLEKLPMFDHKTPEKAMKLFAEEGIL